MLNGIIITLNTIIISNGNNNGNSGGYGHGFSNGNGNNGYNNDKDYSYTIIEAGPGISADDYGHFSK